MDNEPILTNDDLHKRVKAVADRLLSDEEPQFSYRPSGFERVEASIEEMESIPPRANPFHYDDWNMGTDLPRGWIVMHPGFDRKEEPMAMNWLYLVNTRTGQRIRINLNHTPTEEQLCTQRDHWLKKMKELSASGEAASEKPGAGDQSHGNEESSRTFLAVVGQLPPFWKFWRERIASAHIYSIGVLVPMILDFKDETSGFNMWYYVAIFFGFHVLILTTTYLVWRMYPRELDTDDFESRR